MALRIISKTKLTEQKLNRQTIKFLALETQGVWFVVVHHGSGHTETCVNKHLQNTNLQYWTK